jgi:hypothetical protein
MHLGIYQAFLKEPEKEENCNLCLCSSDGLQHLHSTGVHRMKEYRAP